MASRLSILGLFFFLCAGCMNGETARSLRQQLRPLQGLTGPDVVQIEFALIEAPAGDPYLNDQLWTSADEQVVDIDRKAMLEDNGFRIGMIGGITPIPLNSLLASRHSCPDPRRLQTRLNKPSKLELGPTIASCTYQFHHDGQTTELQLDQANCSLSIVPSLAKDGRVKLAITPQVHHGPATLEHGPAPDRSGWAYQEHRAVESYSALSFELTPGPGELVLIGGCARKPGTLGEVCFVRDQESKPVQRLLVLTVSCPSALPPELSTTTNPKSPPIALQARYATARGNSP